MALWCPKLILSIRVARRGEVGTSLQTHYPQRAPKTFIHFSADLIFFTTFSAHALSTCHKYKKTFAHGQMLLHGKIISIRYIDIYKTNNTMARTD
jgi:hypothetical protein